jgi:hypothetical protein
MTSIIQYTAMDDKIMKAPIECYVTYKLEMFPELETEFDNEKWGGEHEVKLEQLNYEGDQNEFEFESEMPYGKFVVLKCEYCFKNNLEVRLALPE